ncbi:hypothetical protein EB093_08640 [bacterium]|nr:hypothetical protein [bacterium]
MFGLIGLSGCGSLTNSTSSNTDSTDQITVLSFSITPDKTSYTAGETVTINCTKTGPEDVGAAWSYSLKGGTLKNPTTTTSNFVVTVGGSGFNMVVTGNPTKRRTVNGVDMIQVSGKNTFSIKVD